MKKSIISFLAVMLIIVFLGVSVITGLYFPGGFSRPTADSAASSDASSTTSEEVDYKTIIPSIFDTENGIRRGLDLVGVRPSRLKHSFRKDMTPAAERGYEQCH